MKSVKIRNKTIFFFFVDIVNLILEGVLYFLSFLPLFWGVRFFLLKKNEYLALCVGIFGWLLAAYIFAILIVILRHILAPELPRGRFLLSSNKLARWFFANRLGVMMDRSPFRPFIYDIALARYCFLRGMGSSVHHSLVMSPNVHILDPGCLSIGKNTIIGFGAIISGHKLEHEVVTLGRVEIGDNVLVGARSLIAPGVKIGNNVIIAAQSGLPRGTVIPDGETWAGNPAHRVDLHDIANLRENFLRDNGRN